MRVVRPGVNTFILIWNKLRIFWVFIRWEWEIILANKQSRHNYTYGWKMQCVRRRKFVAGAAVVSSAFVCFPFARVLTARNHTDENTLMQCDVYTCAPAIGGGSGGGGCVSYVQRRANWPKLIYTSKMRQRVFVECSNYPRIRLAKYLPAWWKLDIWQSKLNSRLLR